MMLTLLILAASPVQWLGPPPPKPATRVISLAPSVTETILALGAKDSLVAVSRFCEFPEVAALPKAGGFNDVSVETIVKLKPDLLVVQKSPGNQKAVETVARLGVPVLALPLTTVEDVTVAMSELGKALGKETRGKELVDALAAVRAKERAVKVEKKKSVLLVVGFQPLVVAGPGSFADELLLDCGVTNAAAKAPTAFPTYSLEKAVMLTPDVVVDAAHVREGREAVEALPPLQKAKWVTLESKELLHPGPALTRALPGLCALIR
ncbi:MAG TPA: helical backbone metal receptor [Archangium sp.]